MAPQGSRVPLSHRLTIFIVVHREQVELWKQFHQALKGRYGSMKIGSSNHHRIEARLISWSFIVAA